MTSYPNRISVHWTKAHIGMLLLAMALWPAYWVLNPTFSAASVPKLLSVSGLFLNTVGATVATLKPPYYGTFLDGGELQCKCEALASRYFNAGMVIVAIGFLLQAAKEIL